MLKYPTIGSLKSFIPSIGSTGKKSNESLSVPRPNTKQNPRKKSMNESKLNIKSALGKFYSETSSGGYIFESSIKLAQERFKTISQQRPRNVSSAKSNLRPKTTNIRRQSIEKTKETSPEEQKTFEACIRNELQY